MDSTSRKKGAPSLDADPRRTPDEARPTGGTAEGHTREDELVEDAKRVFGSGFLKHLASRGIGWVESRRQGAVVCDSNGNEFIDCYCSAGAYNLGRRNPAIARELKRAIGETDQGNFVMISAEKALLAETLARFLPPALDCFLFTVVRGEAVDAACKLARGHTGRAELITVDGGCYGQTGFAMSLSQRPDKQDFGSLIPGIRTIRFNDIEAARRTISNETAAVILEPVQTENSCRAADRDYLVALRALCDKSGALLIFDESQTGFGRTGEKFASDHFGVVPDIMLVGEALSGGLFPIGAMAFTPAVKTFFDAHPLIHLLTFGGHDVGCRVAAAAIEEYERIKPWRNARKQGNRLKQRLTELAESSPKLKAVDGMGLIVSLEFETAEEADSCCRSAIGRGVLLKSGEVAKQSVIIRPPLTINDQELDRIVSGIEEAVADLDDSR